MSAPIFLQPGNHVQRGTYAAPRPAWRLCGTMRTLVTVDGRSICPVTSLCLEQQRLLFSHLLLAPRPTMGASALVASGHRLGFTCLPYGPPTHRACVICNMQMERKERDKPAPKPLMGDMSSVTLISSSQGMPSRLDGYGYKKLIMTESGANCRSKLPNKCKLFSSHRHTHG